MAEERQEIVAVFWQRANMFFTDAGITVTEVMTDNCSCYQSRLFNEMLGEEITTASPGSPATDQRQS